MISPGESLPDFDVRTLEGADVRPSSGDVLLVVYKRNCGASQIAVPQVPLLAEAVPGLRVVLVSQDAEADARRFCGRHAPGMDVAVDPPEFRVSAALDVDSVPCFVLSRDGTVIDAFFGWDRTAFNALARAAGAPGEVAGGDVAPFRPG